MNQTETAYILAIAEHLSITKASEALFVSQPHLSRTLARVEKELGVQLFDRSTLPIQLTYAGKRYIDYCKKHEMLCNQMALEFKNISSATIRQLVIGIPPTRGSYLLPIVLPAFSRLYPQVEIVIRESPSDMVPLMVENGEVNLGIFSLPEMPPRIHCRVLIRDLLLLMVPSSHPLAYSSQGCSRIPRLETRMLDMLDGQEFISIDSPKSITTRLIRFLRQYHARCSISIRTRNNIMTYRLCEQGMGLAAIMEVAAHNTTFHQPPCLYQIGEPPLHENWYIGTRLNQKLTPIEESFIAIVQEYAPQMVASPFQVIG